MGPVLNQFHYRYILALALCLCIAQAWAQQNAADFYEDARQRYYGDDAAGAVIQLKNALKLDSQHVPSLILFGEILVEKRQLPAAEHAFTEALLFGGDPDYIAPKLASVLLTQGKYSDLINKLPPQNVSVAVRAELLGYHALAYLSLDEIDSAEQAIESAVAIDPDALTPGLAKVKLETSNGDYADALLTAKKLVVNHPDSDEALLYLGIVHESMGNTASALDVFSKILERSPDYPAALLSRAAIYVDQRQDAKAGTDLDTYTKTYPLDARAVFLQAQIKGRAGDLAGEISAMQKVVEILQAIPPEVAFGDPQLALIGARASYRLGNFELARRYLVAYLRQDPGSVDAAVMLASSLLALGDSARAIEVLDPVYFLHQDNASVVGMMAAAYTQQGRLDKANQLLTRLGDQLSPEPWVGTQLARNRLSAGQTAEGLASLEDIYFADKQRLGAGYSLAVSYLDLGRAGDASIIAAELVDKNPQSVTYIYLLGLSEFAAGNTEKARTAFLECNKITPGYPPAEVSIARIDRVSGNYEPAFARLQNLLDSDYENVAALMEMAQLELARGDTGRALNSAEEAARVGSNNIKAKLLLVEILKRLDELEQAEKVAWETVLAFEENLDALAALADVQVIKGDRAASLQTYRTMQKFAGYNAGQLYRIAQLQIRQGGWEDASNSLYKALESKPDHIPYLITNLRVHTALKRYDAALEIADAILAIDPDSAEALGLKGHVFLAMRQPEQAEKSFVEANVLDYDRRWIIGRYQAQLAQNLPQQAEATLQVALRQHSEDTVLRITLVDHLLERARWSDARPEIDQLLAINPDQPIHLNNMAVVLNELGADGAEEYARKAYALVPENGNFNDTLGWVLASKGKYYEALPHLREASLRESGNPQIIYHLAVVLHQLERNREAAVELERSLSMGDNFPEREVAAQLLKDLNRGN